MLRLLIYYYKVIKHKIRFIILGMKFKIPFSILIKHNNDLLKLSYSVEMSKFVYNKNGTLRNYTEYSSDRNYLRLVTYHNSRSAYAISNWDINNDNLELQIKEYLLDMYTSYYPNYESFKSDTLITFLNDSKLYKLYYYRVNELINNVFKSE